MSYSFCASREVCLSLLGSRVPRLSSWCFSVIAVQTRVLLPLPALGSLGSHSTSGFKLPGEERGDVFVRLKSSHFILCLDGNEPKGFNSSLLALAVSENGGGKLPKLLFGWVVPGFRA